MYVMSGGHSSLDNFIYAEGNDVITSVYVLYGTVLSDHTIVAADIGLQLAPDLDRWSDQGDDAIYKYCVNSEMLLINVNVEIPTEDCNCA